MVVDKEIERGGVCQKRMANGKMCGRKKVFNENEENVCVFHSRSRDQEDFLRQLDEKIKSELVNESFEQVDFTGYVFSDQSSQNVRFTKSVCFRNAVFPPRMAFVGCEFLGPKTDFTMANFSCQTPFTRCSFESSELIFDQAQFAADKTSFDESIFAAKFISFYQTRFGGDVVSFKGTTFKGDRVSFQGALFQAKEVFFSNTSFNVARLIFDYSIWEGRVIFEESRDPSRGKLFNDHVEMKNMSIRDPQTFSFRHVDLSTVELRGTNLRKIDFVAVKWRRSGGSKSRSFWRQPRVILLDEECIEWKANNREVELVRTAYRQLKQNYDDERNFSVADDFYFGEMDAMLRVGNWQMKYLSWRSLYRWTSGYGLYWTNSFFSLLITALVFPVIFLFSGMDAPSINYDLSFSIPNLSALWSDLVKTFVYSTLSLFSLRDLGELYTPSICTRLIHIIELVLVPTFSTLTILAIRRRFKR